MMGLNLSIDDLRAAVIVIAAGIGGLIGIGILIGWAVWG